MKVEVKGIDPIIAEIKEITEKFKKGDLSKRRADAFKEYVTVRVENNGLGLASISDATKKIRHQTTGADDTPMVNQGRLLHAMQTRSYKDGSAQAGYFSGGGNYPDSGKSFLDIAALHHLEGGFRVPLSGDGGSRVRKFLFVHGVTPGASKEYLHVRSRPFLYIGADLFVSSKEDDDVIKEYMDSIL